MSAENVTKQASSFNFYVITVNYNSKHHLRALVHSLRHISCLKKLIIVNHSPWEGLDDLETDIPLQIINQENKGYGAGLNRGLLELVDSDAIALLCNPDVVVLNPDAIEDVLNYMSLHPKVACVFPSQVDKNLLPTRSCRQFYTLMTLLVARIPVLGNGYTRLMRRHYYVDRHSNGPFEVDWGSGSAMLFRTSLFRNPLSFDERFFLYFEDVDFCADICQRGFSAVFHPALVCRHDAQRQSHKEVYFFAQHLISLLKYIRKYGRLPRRDDLNHKNGGEEQRS